MNFRAGSVIPLLWQEYCVDFPKVQFQLTSTWYVAVVSSPTSWFCVVFITVDWTAPIYLLCLLCCGRSTVSVLVWLTTTAKLFTIASRTRTNRGSLLHKTGLVATAMSPLLKWFVMDVVPALSAPYHYSKTRCTKAIYDIFSLLVLSYCSQSLFQGNALSVLEYYARPGVMRQGTGDLAVWRMGYKRAAQLHSHRYQQEPPAHLARAARSHWLPFFVV